MRKLMPAVGFMVLVAMSGCGQAAVADQRPAQASSPAAQPATAPPAPPATVPPTATPAPPTPAPTPPPPAISLAFGSGAVTISVSGITNGAHQVHVHRDCTGNPNLHITTLGNVLVNSDGAGSQTFSLAPSLRGRGFDLLVYPLGASQGPPSLCTGI
jgi:hypothetical protein